MVGGPGNSFPPLAILALHSRRGGRGHQEQRGENAPAHGLPRPQSEGLPSRKGSIGSDSGPFSVQTA